MSQINVESVTVSYHGQVALYDANLQVNKGDFIGIIGENGSGKTTLLNAILGLVNTQDGSVQIDPSITLGYVPQYIQRQDYIFPATAKEVVLMGLLSEKKGWKRFSKKDHKRANEMFELLRIGELKHKRIGELSGGQQQRVLLARALINKPDVIILDEPTSALDKYTETSFLDLLKEKNQKENVTIIIVTHDLASLEDYVKHVVFINKHIVFEGSFRDFCQNNELSPYIHTHELKGCDQ
jgi:zinc transport system ATP-binding protein